MIRSKVSIKIKKVARNLFESGVDMFDIHQELKINLGTLYNMSSREGWEKGKKKELLHLLEMENETEELIKIREKKIEEYKALTETSINILKELQEETHLTPDERSVRSLVKCRAEAAVAQAKVIAITYSLDKELYSIRTGREEIELKASKVRYEILKKELKPKVTITLDDD